MKKVVKKIGLIIVFGSSVAITWHRFLYPDMTQVRWFIEFWNIWLAWFILTIVGYGLYLFGANEIKQKKGKTDKNEIIKKRNSEAQRRA